MVISNATFFGASSQVPQVVYAGSDSSDPSIYISFTTSAGDVYEDYNWIPMTMGVILVAVCVLIMLVCFRRLYTRKEDLGGSVQFDTGSAYKRNDDMPPPITSPPSYPGGQQVVYAQAAPQGGYQGCGMYPSPAYNMPVATPLYPAGQGGVALVTAQPYGLNQRQPQSYTNNV